MGNTSLAWFLSSPWTSTPHTCIYCKGLPTFCPFGVHSAQTVVDFAHFQIQGVFWGGVGVFCVSTYPKRGLWRLSKNRGWWRYSGQNETPSGQNETSLGNLYEKWAEVLQNQEKKIQSSDDFRVAGSIVWVIMIVLGIHAWVTTRDSKAKQY